MKLRNIIQLFDAMGLGVFTAIGAMKGMFYDVSFIGVLLCGVITAIGGGIIRDVLVREVPVVLRSDFYATASLMGGILCYFLHIAGAELYLNFLLTSLFVFSVRFMAIYMKLQLPEAHTSLKHFSRAAAPQKKKKK